MDAKFFNQITLNVKLVSIHAPVMDAKQYPIGFTAVDNSFNPRARDGREPTNRIGLSHARVSIHAPVMDAKQLRVRLKALQYQFQSTRP